MTYCKHCSIDSATLSWQAERIEELETKVTLAEDQVRALQAAGAAVHNAEEVMRLRDAHNLSHAQATVLHLLLTNDRVSRDDLLRCYKRRDITFTPDRNLLAVTIHQLRIKLRPLGLHIDNIWGFGYTIPRNERERVAA